MANRNALLDNPVNTLLLVGGGLALWKFFGPDEGAGPPPPPSGDPQELDPRPATWPRATYVQIADALDTLMFDYFTEDEEQVMRLVLSMRNTADVLNLVDAYGVRFHVLPWGDFTLGNALHKYLEPAEIDAINMGFARNGIHYVL